MGHAHKAMHTKIQQHAQYNTPNRRENRNLKKASSKGRKRIKYEATYVLIWRNGTKWNQVTYRNKEERYSFTFETKR